MVAHNHQLEIIVPDEAAKTRFPHLRFADRCYLLDGTYVVGVNEVGGFTHVKVREVHDRPVNDWYVLQEIKNLVLGEDAQAVQVYPREKDLVDGSNTYHLWTWAEIGKVLPNLKAMERYR